MSVVHPYILREVELIKYLFDRETTPDLRSDVDEAKANTSEEKLRQILEEKQTIFKAKDKCRFKFKRWLSLAGFLNGNLNGVVGELYGGRWKMSGFSWYPVGGYLGWHTNEDHPGRRLYIIHAAEANKSCFKYWHHDKVETMWDDAGWTARMFDVPKEKKFWHCVYTETPRFSLGFREL